MKQLLSGATCSAVVLAAGMAVFAQATPQSPAQPPSTSGAQTAQETPRASDAQQMTLVGCVQRESEYRRAKGAGAGGAAGTGVGAGNEFVLVNASASEGSSAAAASPAGTAGNPASPSGTVGTSGAAGAFELTGSGESELEQFVGKRVEIIGKMKDSAAMSDRSPAVRPGATTSTPGAPGADPTSTIGTPSGRPASPAGGNDIMGQDLKLKEFEVVSVREASGSCAQSER